MKLPYLAKKSSGHLTDDQNAQVQLGNLDQSVCIFGPN